MGVWNVLAVGQAGHGHSTWMVLHQAEQGVHMLSPGRTTREHGRTVWDMGCTVAATDAEEQQLLLAFYLPFLPLGRS